MTENKEKNKSNDKNKNKRHDKSEDTLRKLSHAYLGETVHKYFGLPGEYKHAIENEFPDKDGKEKRTDGAYIVDLDGKDMIISIEDESSVVNEETLKKIYGYCVNMEYGCNLPVHSVITTPIPLDRCKKVYFLSETLQYMPKIISFNEFDGEEHLEYARAKVNNNELFSDVEGYDLVNIPKMFGKGDYEVLEEVCELFSNMRMEDKKTKFQLSKALECNIHKYAKTEDIKRLMEVVNMMKIRKDAKQIIEEVHEEGRQEGRQEERLDLTRKFAEKFNIDEVSQISGLSKEQILKTEH